VVCYACFSPSTTHSGFHQVARMMDSLILDPFSPFTFTKITTTHRPVRDGGSKRSTGTQHPRQKAAPVRAQHPPEQGESPSMTSFHWSVPQMKREASQTNCYSRLLWCTACLSVSGESCHHYWYIILSDNPHHSPLALFL